MKRAKIKKGRPDWLPPLDDPRDERVLGAALDVFGDKGFHGATMLEIATRARASKKTIYERFEDKAALFRALVAWGCRHNLPAAIPPDDGEPARALERHGVTLLIAMLRPEALALTRIVIAEGGRFPEIGAAFDAAVRKDSVAILNVLAERLGVRDTARFGEDFIALLRGDVYFRVLAGAVAIPSGAEIAKQAKHAAVTVLRAYSSN